MLGNDLFFDDCEDLTAEDFYLPSHRTVFQTIASLLLGEAEESHADIITISNELRFRKELTRMGGVAFLASLTEGLPRRPSLREYVVIVKEKAKLRKLAKLGDSLWRNTTQGLGDPELLVAQVERGLIDIEAGDTDDAVHVGDLTAGIKERIMKMRNLSLDKTVLEMTWGIEELDRKTKGMFGGELTVIGADSGGGKSQAVAQMVLENAMRGTTCHVFSMEMEKQKFAQRMYPLMSTIITASLMRDPRGMTLHTHVPEIDRIESAIRKLPIYIDDTAPLTLNRFIAKMKKSSRQHDTKLFVADYLQLLSVPGQKDLQEVKAVMFACRDFIKKKENESRHLVMLSQYAKEQGFVRKKRRTKGDLHGGAVIHQAAQNVLLITVESPDKKEPGSNLDVEIMIDKQREGPRGKVYCQWDPNSLRYIPAPPPTEKKPDEQPKANAKRTKPKPNSGGEEETGTGFLREDQG